MLATTRRRGSKWALPQWATAAGQRDQPARVHSQPIGRHTSHSGELRHPHAQAHSKSPGVGPGWRWLGAPSQEHRQPVLDICGGGIHWFWKAGVLQFLQQHHNLAAVRLHGFSSGALVAALAACEVDLGRAAERGRELLVQHGVYDRPFGLAGVWGHIARQCLEELLPEDCHTRCSGRVQLCITLLPSLRPLFLDHFHSKDDLIDACMASGHLPFFLDGRLSASFRGTKAVDGIVGCWLSRMRGSVASGGGSLRQGGSEALEADGGGSTQGVLLSLQAGHLGEQGAAGPGFMPLRFILNHSFDERLNLCRFASIRLRSLEQLQQMMQMGVDFGRRLQRQGVWDAWLGQGRTMQL